MDTAPPLQSERRHDPRRRELHPERIVVGDKTLERNDLVARRYGESERSVNRRDRLGAPCIFISGIKYRPQPDYDNFLLSSCIQVHKPQPSRRRKAR
jgi:hypothetical protein